MNMRDAPHPSRTGLLLSGGIDSAVLLAHLLERGWQVVPFYVRTGCVWQPEELHAVRHFVQTLARPSLLELVQLEMPLEDIYGRHWSITGNQVPDDRSPDEAVFLPGRNPLLLMKPALWCHAHGIAQLALATLAGNPFPDATPEFFARFEAMLHAALEGEVQITRPFERLTKSRVLELGRRLPLELTFSCLAPVDGLHCGHCNKCAERRRGFLEIGLEDRTRYFDRSPIKSHTVTLVVDDVR
jgi:7-cyano-7-deazaguanine synthase